MVLRVLFVLVSSAWADDPSTAKSSQVHDLDDEDSPTSASLGADVVAETVKANMWAVQDCYQRYAFKKQSGRMSVEFEVGPDGLVRRATVASSDLKNIELETCVVEAVKRARFPKSDGAATVTTFPFVF